MCARPPGHGLLQRRRPELLVENTGFSLKKEEDTTTKLLSFSYDKGTLPPGEAVSLPRAWSLISCHTPCPHLQAASPALWGFWSLHGHSQEGHLRTEPRLVLAQVHPRRLSHTP